MRQALLVLLLLLGASCQTDTPQERIIDRRPHEPSTRPFVVGFELSSEPAASGPFDNAVTATLTFTNSTDEQQPLLKAIVPSDGDLLSDVFEIIGDQKRAPCVGPLIRITEPTPEDFYQVQPHASINREVEITANYAFPENGGEFTVRDPATNVFTPKPAVLQSVKKTFVLKPKSN